MRREWKELRSLESSPRPTPWVARSMLFVAIGRIPGVRTTQEEKVANVWLIP